jgi:hypothetical protein
LKYQHLTWVEDINSFAFNLPMSNCMDNCKYSFKNEGSGIGYCISSNDHRFHSKKREGNQKLINGDESIFLKTIIKEIKRTKHTNFRINSIGDFEFNNNGIKQFEKILNLAKHLPKIDFWITTHNEYVLTKLFHNSKQELKNISIQLSHPEPNGIWDDFLKKYWNEKNIACTSTTRFKNKSNCNKSLKKTNGCQDCNQCYTPGFNTVFYLHGKYAKSRLRKYLKNSTQAA